MKYINNEKLKKIKLNQNNFYVAIDFDRTITAKESCDSWDASGEALGEEYKKEADEKYQKYAPIELDYTISIEEKREAMEEWYYGVMGLYYKYHLTKEMMEKSIKNSPIIFREGAKEFLQKMYQSNIPVIILSAGIGNVIEQVLKSNNCYFENMYIISNFIEFDEKGNMKKYSKEIIHTLNKTREGHLSREFVSKIENKEYRLLLGDLIEDKNMIPAEEFDKTISVAFLNKKIEENIEVFKENFDIVLTKEDATFKVVEKIIGE